MKSCQRRRKGDGKEKERERLVCETEWNRETERVVKRENRRRFDRERQR